MFQNSGQDSPPPPMMGNTGQLVFIPEPPSKKKPVPVVVKVSEVKKNIDLGLTTEIVV